MKLCGRVDIKRSAWFIDTLIDRTCLEIIHGNICKER